MNTSFDQTTTEQSSDQDTSKDADYHLDLTQKEFDKEAEIIEKPNSARKLSSGHFDIEEPSHKKEDPEDPD